MDSDHHPLAVQQLAADCERLGFPAIWFGNGWAGSRHLPMSPPSDRRRHGCAVLRGGRVENFS